MILLHFWCSRIAFYRWTAAAAFKNKQQLNLYAPRLGHFHPEIAFRETGRRREGKIEIKIDPTSRESSLSIFNVQFDVLRRRLGGRAIGLYLLGMVIMGRRWNWVPNNNHKRNDCLWRGCNWSATPQSTSACKEETATKAVIDYSSINKTPLAHYEPVIYLFHCPYSVEEELQKEPSGLFSILVSWTTGLFRSVDVRQ